MIIPCGYCNQDTAGNHEYNCPNQPRMANIVSEKFESWQLEQYVVGYSKLAYENQKQAAEIVYWKRKFELEANRHNDNLQQRDNKINQQAEQIKQAEQQWADAEKRVNKLLAENQRLKEENERWRILLFKITEKYVSDVLNADSDVVLELLEKALKGQENETNTD